MQNSLNSSSSTFVPRDSWAKSSSQHELFSPYADSFVPGSGVFEPQTFQPSPSQPLVQGQQDFKDFKEFTPHFFNPYSQEKHQEKQQLNYTKQSNLSFAANAPVFYPNQNSNLRQPENRIPQKPVFHHPPTTLPHQVYIQPGRVPIHSFFVSETLRRDLHERNSLILKGTSLDDLSNVNLPAMVGSYHSFYSLELNNGVHGGVSKTFGVQTTVYKCHSLKDGLPYVLRKVDISVRINAEFALKVFEKWKAIQCTGIVSFREVFRSNPSLFFAYDYHPASETLESKYFNTGNTTAEGIIPEETIWSFVVQIVSVIHTIHSNKQTCRGVLVASKILVTGKNRYRLNCVGLEDIISPDPIKNILQAQHNDLVNFGKLIVNFICKSNDAIRDIARSMEYINSNYSGHLNELIISLCNKKPSNAMTIEDIPSIISHAAWDQMERLTEYNDTLEAELSKTIENGRLYRLVVKLGFINERPEQETSSSWSETGDRYLIKLLRDYIFHQVSEDGVPVLDFAHVTDCLNKLDVGVSEKIMLSSRNEKSALIVSYKEMKRIVNEAFNDLSGRQALVENRTNNIIPNSYSGLMPDNL